MGTCRGQSSEEFDEKIILNKKKQATCQYIGKYFGVTQLTSREKGLKFVKRFLSFSQGLLRL